MNVRRISAIMKSCIKDCTVSPLQSVNAWYKSSSSLIVPNSACKNDACEERLCNPPPKQNEITSAFHRNIGCLSFHLLLANIRKMIADFGRIIMTLKLSNWYLLSKSVWEGFKTTPFECFGGWECWCVLLSCCCWNCCCWCDGFCCWCWWGSAPLNRRLSMIVFNC